MARNHARILTAIWSNDEFLELDLAAQRVYLLLLSQPDLTPCGALPYIPKRWARLCTSTTTEDVEKAVQALRDARFVLVDEDTDELVIRTFVIHDGGLANSKMRGAVKSALGALHSRWLRAAIVDVIPDEHRPSISDGLPIERRSDCRSNDDPNSAGSPIGSNAEVGGRRQGLVTTGHSASSPRPAQPAAVRRGERIPEDFDLTAEREGWARQRCPGLDVVLHHERFVNHWRAKTGRDATKLDWDATWRNWMLREYAARPLSPRPVEPPRAQRPTCPQDLCGGSGNVTGRDGEYLGRCVCVGGPISSRDGAA